MAAGSTEPYDIYIWSLKSGQLLETFSSHTAPISGLSFSPASAMNDSGSFLASASWDNTVKIWDIYGKKQLLETLQHSSEVVSCEFHPVIKNELVTTTLSGQMFLWDADTGDMKSFIECRQDLAGGRLQDDRNTAQKSTKNKHFNAVSLSPNGDFCIGGGNSKHICLYDLKYRILIRRFAVTQNRSLDGVLHKLNSKNIKEGGMMQHEIDELDSDLEEDAWQIKDDLPGAKTAKNLVKRNVKLAVRVKAIKFSPDGSTFAAATTEGLVIYSNKLNQTFNPVMITEEVTLDNIILKVKEEEYLVSLALALRLNEPEVTQTVYQCIPLKSVPLVCANFPEPFVAKLLQFIGTQIKVGRQLEWAMHWLSQIVRFKGVYLQRMSQEKSGVRTALLDIYQSVQFFDSSLSKVFNQNQHLMSYIINKHRQEQEEDPHTTTE